MPEYSYAIISALLWAISAPIVNRGMENFPEENRSSATFIALFCALITGTLSLYPFTSNDVFDAHNINVYIILSGVFTFPIATGLYYLSTHAFGVRAELASQFAKVKPLFSILFAAFFLGETIEQSSIIAIALIIIGLLMFVKAAWIANFSIRALLFGLLTAMAWATGEVFVKLGFQEANALDNSFIALASSLLLVLIIILPSLKQFLVKSTLTWIAPFAIHGILSFSFAYACFFKSITMIGVTKTVIINAFWPALSVLIVFAQKRFMGEPYKISVYLIAAIVLLVSASITVITNIEA
ncbi:EamA family transporter [Nitrosomonas aestuarii]|uniref:EamA family transporter n=1 Tax=Nitrosomonas aestuarii TaxID=52441 RepID=UPI000D2F4A9A|nr:EamA family transporter [Nitrosomonas aestuarii]PTN13014.1 EamA-like transporter family protein [Nitrosomonas aestuarii]